MHNPPKWYLPVAIAALLWNLMGCAAYLMDVMLTPEDVAKLSEAQQAAYAARPGWSVAATAIGVWTGVLGCVGLILRRSWALWLLLLSLLGVIVQDIQMFGMSSSPVDVTALVLQGLVLVIAFALVLLARRGTRLGWLR
jgi:hypothetical protein